MINCGVTGKVYHVLKTSYNSPQFYIKTDHGLIKHFTSSTGVKQGCILSLLLSNIFQNDLHDIFDDRCDPFNLNKMFINSLSLEDDLALISRSKPGLYYIRQA